MFFLYFDERMHVDLVVLLSILDIFCLTSLHSFITRSYTGYVVHSRYGQVHQPRHYLSQRPAMLSACSRNKQFLAIFVDKLTYYIKTFRGVDHKHVRMNDGKEGFLRDSREYGAVLVLR